MTRFDVGDVVKLRIGCRYGNVLPAGTVGILVRGCAWRPRGTKLHFHAFTRSKRHAGYLHEHGMVCNNSAKWRHTTMPTGL